MAFSIYQIIANFPHKAFPVVDVEPDYQIIHDMCTLLYINFTPLTTDLGGGNNVHIRINMQDMLYAKISPTPYESPVYLGVTETVPLQATTS